MKSKFILVLGDDETEVFDVERDLMKEREIGLNFEQSPSVVVLYETYDDYAREAATELRDRGLKVGVYGSRGKAMKFFWKALGFSEDGSVNLNELESVQFPLEGR